MTFDPFSILTHRASPSRRASIEVPIQASPMTEKARKKHRKKGDVNKRCKQQAEEWSAFVPTICEDGTFCDLLIACGTPLAICDFSSFLGCLGGGPADLTDAVSAA